MLSLKVISSAGVATLLLLVVAMPASAAPIWNVDFESDTVGLNPAVGVPTVGATNTIPSGILEQFANTVLVQDGYTDTVNAGASLSSNVLVLSDVATNGQAGVIFDGADADAVSTGIYEIEFDMILESTGDGLNNFLDIKNTAGGVIAGVQFTPSTPRVRLVEYSSPGVVLGVSDAAVGGTFFSDELNVRYRIDFGAATQEILINDVSLVIGNLPGSGAVNLDSFRFDTSGGAVEVWALDNITGTVIPEPSSLLLLGLGLIGIVARRRKQ